MVASGALACKHSILSSMSIKGSWQACFLDERDVDLSGGQLSFKESLSAGESQTYMLSLLAAPVPWVQRKGIVREDAYGGELTNRDEAHLSAVRVRDEFIKK